MVYRSKQRILNRRISNGQRHLNCSTSLVSIEMQIKTTLRYNPTQVRMAKIKNTDHSLCWKEWEVRGILLHCGGNANSQPLWKSVLWFLRKLGIHLPQDSAIPLLGIKDAHSYDRDICSTVFIICNSQNLETT